MEIKITSETGEDYFYSTKKKSTRTCSIQVGKSGIEKNNDQPKKSVIGTPKKWSVKTRPRQTLKVQNLPGKKKEIVKPKKQRSGRCKGVNCQIIWNSVIDREFQKRVGARRGQWIGCDEPKCSYWGHAECIGVVLTGRKPAKQHPFRCPEHKI